LVPLDTLNPLDTPSNLLPPAFAQLLGQQQAMQLLQQAIQQNRIAPAYLFTGPDGVGRSLAAQGFIQQLFTAGITADNKANRSSESAQRLIWQRLQQSNHPDRLWVEPTYLQQGKLIPQSQIQEGEKGKTRPQIRLEQIRELVRFLSRPPLEAPRSVVVLEQAETMAEAAANALLKTLEEPGRATLILLVPSEVAILPTLVSRCQRIPFSRLSEADCAQVLTNLGETDLLQQPQILAMAEGSPGAALMHWRQWQAIPAELLQACQTRPSTPRQALELAQQVSKSLETETQLWLLDYLQHWFWQQYHQRQFLEPLEAARQQLRSYAQPQLVWEVAWLKLSHQR
jgi:DNA polymerase III subunit delta'